MSAAPHPSTSLSLPGPAGVVGHVLVVGVFALYWGIPGALLGLVLVAVGLFASPVVTFAVGQVFLVGLADDPTGAQVALAQFALAPLLVDGVVRDGIRRRTVGEALVLAGSFVALAALVTLAVDVTDELWQAAGILAAVVAVAGYGIHRYERVSLGIETEDTP